MDVILKIYMLGETKVFVENSDITSEFPQKSLALLCYLAYHKTQKIKRNKLIYMFWNESSEEASRYNLRYNLWYIRKVLRKYFVDTDFIISPSQSTCQFNCKVEHYIDTYEFDQAFKRDDSNEEALEAAVEIYKGNFLEGSYIKESPEFDNWIFFERERLQKMLLAGLSLLSEAYVKETNSSKSIAHLERMLSFNSLQEDIYLKLMKLHFESKDMCSAANVYKRYAKLMREELNLPPSPEAQKMFSIINCEENKTSVIRIEDLNQPRMFFLNIEEKYKISKSIDSYIPEKDLPELYTKLQAMRCLYYTFHQSSCVKNENAFEFMSHLITTNSLYIKNQVSTEWLNIVSCVLPEINLGTPLKLLEFGSEYRFFYSSYKIIESLLEQFEIVVFLNKSIQDPELLSFIRFLESKLKDRLRIYYIA